MVLAAGVLVGVSSGALPSSVEMAVLSYGGAVSAERGASPPLDVRVDVDGASIIVWLRGELDMDSVPDLRKAFVRVFAEPAHDIVVDLSDLAFLDSSGIRALLDSCTTAKERGT